MSFKDGDASAATGNEHQPEIPNEDDESDVLSLEAEDRSK